MHELSRRAAAIALAALMLAACGGGGNRSDDRLATLPYTAQQPLPSPTTEDEDGDNAHMALSETSRPQLVAQIGGRAMHAPIAAYEHMSPRDGYERNRALASCAASDDYPRSCNDFRRMNPPPGWMLFGGWYRDEDGNVAIDDGIQTRRYLSVGAMPRDQGEWVLFGSDFPSQHRKGKAYVATATSLEDGARVEYGTDVGYPSVELVRDYLRQIGWISGSEITNAVVSFRHGTTGSQIDLAVRAVQAINSALPLDARMNVVPVRRSADYVILPGEIVVGFAPMQEWPDSILQSVWVPDSDGNYPAIGGVATIGRGGREVWMNTSFMESDHVPVSTDAESLAGMVHELIHALAAFEHVDTGFGVDHSIGVYGGEGGSIMSVGAPYYPNGAMLYPIDRAALQAVFSGPGNLGAWNDTALHYWAKFDGFEAGATYRNGHAHGWAHGDMPRANLADGNLFGMATWYGRLFGFTPDGAPVSGGAEIGVGLDTLTGEASFTALERWAAEPGAAGTGTRWLDGDLGYTIAVTGNTFHETGGDAGRLTGIFTGANHEGAAGTLERSDLSAAFGATR